MTSVRRATPGDAHRLAVLRYRFRAEEDAPVESESEFVGRCEPWMADRLDEPSPWLCWVAEHEGEIAGQLWLQVVEKVPNPGPELEQHAYITNVYLRPEARGVGLGEQLVATAMEWCRANGVDSAILWPTPRSRALYARHGFAVRDDVMEAVVNPGRDIH